MADLIEDAKAIIKVQNDLAEQENALQKADPVLFARIKAVEDAKKNVDTMWDALKAKLVEAGDFDVHEVTLGNATCRFSLSKTVKIGVEDIEKVPEEFVEVKKVADESKLKKSYELYGKIPEGCIDKSFVRLNKRITIK